MKKIAYPCLAACLLACGCTDASWERKWSYGSKHKVVMYSGGVAVGEWTTSGKPQSIADEDGWTFVDDETGKLVIVTGDTVITKIGD
jgi:hypothetical protein